VKEFEQLELGAQSPFGKQIIKMLNDSIDDAVSKFRSDKIDAMDDSQFIRFCSAVRSKLQTLESFKQKLIEAQTEKNRRIAEIRELTKNQ
jgi:hypothetical protein